jgi:hypothetical protein
MKKFFKNIILSSVLLLNIIPFFSFWNWEVTLYGPDAIWQDDVNIGSTQIQWKENTIFTFIQTINKYLWFWLGWVAMAVLIYAGIMMITASWDKSKFSKAWKLALCCIIAIAVAMLSYNLVILIVNLF